MRVTVTGTGYVGLVTGVCLAEVGHSVICYDVDQPKIDKLKAGISPIYEPGLEELIRKNLDQNRLSFTSRVEQAYQDQEIIIVAVGTPEKEDGSANLCYLERAAEQIGKSINRDTVVVIKSTVPIGTNEKIIKQIRGIVPPEINVEIVSNPEFLREGAGIEDTFNGERIVIGSNHDEAAKLVEELYQPFSIPVVRTDLRSAEMIKYASNTFLATKISFINEMANLCEKMGSNIEDVALGMGLDSRIGHQFLRAGIGFGGSCFPKDTKALENIANQNDFEFKILQSVIEVNSEQKQKLFVRAKELMGSVTGKKAAVLGLAFKPNTDDVREAPSIDLINSLLNEQAEVVAYDPVASEKMKSIFEERIEYASSPELAIEDAELAFIVTEWPQIKRMPLELFKDRMKTPIILDGRNCYSLEEARSARVSYISIGREKIIHFQKVRR
jgi:UDPglucose 6-dehydrogenase